MAVHADVAVAPRRVATQASPVASTTCPLTNETPAVAEPPRTIASGSVDFARSSATASASALVAEDALFGMNRSMASSITALVASLASSAVCCAVLTGLAAVQTLSRLNRTMDGKDGTVVLDFRNEVEEIQEAFESLLFLFGSHLCDPLYRFAEKFFKLRPARCSAAAGTSSRRPAG